MEGGEFTAHVAGHRCRWLNVDPSTRTRRLRTEPRDRGANGRVALGSLVATLPKMASTVDHCVLPACWVQRVTPDPAFPANMTPLRALLGRDARPLIDTTTLSIDGAEFR